MSWWCGTSSNTDSDNMPKTTQTNGTFETGVKVNQRSSMQTSRTNLIPGTFHSYHEVDIDDNVENTRDDDTDYIKGVRRLEDFESSKVNNKTKSGNKGHRFLLKFGWSKLNVGLSFKHWYTGFERVLGSFWNGLAQQFASPLKNDPIFFARPEESGGVLGAEPSYFDAATKELIDGVFEERREKIKGYEGFNWMTTVDLADFPGWSRGQIESLWDKFQVLDVNGDGHLTFEELCLGLDNTGNAATEEQRKDHFIAIDKDKSGNIDFAEFCKMAYTLEKTDSEDFNKTLLDLYNSLDRDVNMIRNFSVIELLQSGLF